LEYEEVSEILEMPLGYVTYLISTTGFIGGLLTLFNAFYYTKQMFSNKPSESDMSIKGKEA
jgi:hypothetical protein